MLVVVMVVVVVVEVVVLVVVVVVLVVVMVVVVVGVVFVSWFAQPASSMSVIIRLILVFISYFIVVFWDKYLFQENCSLTSPVSAQ